MGTAVVGAPPGRQSAAAEALRRQAASRRGGHPPAPPPPPEPSTPARRPLTPLQAVLLDGATVAGLTSVVVGFVLIGLGWRGLAATVDVQVQVSYLVSGGIAGVAVIGVGCGLLALQADRYIDALEDRAWAALATSWRDLGAVVTRMGEALETDPTVELPRLPVSPPVPHREETIPLDLYRPPASPAVPPVPGEEA